MDQVNPSVYAALDAEQAKERKKIIIISIVAIALILILLIAIIVTATSHNQNDSLSGDKINLNVASEDFEVVEVKTEAKQPESKEIETKSETQSPAAKEQPAVQPVATSTETIAQTGPEDIIPLAIVSGTITTFLTSFYLNKKSV